MCGGQRGNGTGFYPSTHFFPVSRIGHILCRNCFLQQVIEGNIKGGIEVRGRRGRRRRKLLDDLKKRRGYSHLKEEALDRTMWRARFVWGFGPVVRQTTEWMNHSTFAPYSLSSTCYAYQEDRRMNPANLKKGKTLSEKWEHWIDSYFKVVLKGLIWLWRKIVRNACSGVINWMIVRLSKRNFVKIKIRVFCPLDGCSRFSGTTVGRLQLKCDGTRWRTGGEVRGKLANGVGSQHFSHYLGTWCIHHYYRWCAHLGCQ